MAASKSKQELAALRASVENQAKLVSKANKMDHHGLLNNLAFTMRCLVDVLMYLERQESPKPRAPEVRYKQGQMFSNNGEQYILCQPLASHIQLICLDEGDRWCEPVKVNNVQYISQAEFDCACGATGIGKFKLLPESI